MAVGSALTRAVSWWPAASRARAAATVLVPWPPRAPIRWMVRDILVFLDSWIDTISRPSAGRQQVDVRWPAG